MLARVLTDRSIREACIADPRRAAGELGLDEAQMRQLAALSATQVRFHAQSLCQKRLIAARQQLPLTHRLLGTQFEELFRGYAERTPLPPGDRYRTDALEFGEFLMRQLRRGVAPMAGAGREEPRRSRSLPLCWPGTLRYEVTRLRAAGGGFRPRFGLFCLPVLSPVRPHPAPGGDAAPRTVWVFAIWWGPGRRGRLWEMRLPLGRFPKRIMT